MANQINHDNIQLWSHCAPKTESKLKHKSITLSLFHCVNPASDSAYDSDESDIVYQSLSFKPTKKKIKTADRACDEPRSELPHHCTELQQEPLQQEPQPEPPEHNTEYDSYFARYDDQYAQVQI